MYIYTKFDVIIHIGIYMKRSPVYCAKLAGKPIYEFDSKMGFPGIFYEFDSKMGFPAFPDVLVQKEDLFYFYMIYFLPMVIMI